MKKLEADVAIVGGGPGGCTLAKELSKKGKKIVLLEKGGDDDRLLGNGMGVLLRLEKGFHFSLPLKKTKEGDTVILAKWTAREFAYEAIKNGTTLLANTEVNEIIIENGTVGGVRAKGKGGQKYQIDAKVVVCSAGGTHTSRLLQRSGFPDAGSWFCGDPTFFTFGFVKDGPGKRHIRHKSYTGRPGK